jgi:hypothetical protein
MGFFEIDRVLRTIYPGWLRTASLLISHSRVARVAGVNHLYLASISYQRCTLYTEKQEMEEPFLAQAEGNKRLGEGGISAIPAAGQARSPGT